MSTTNNQPTALHFVETFTTAQMAQVLGTSKVNIIRSPKTQKNFFADEAGNPVGAVSTKITSPEDLQKPLMFAKVQPCLADADGKLLMDDNGKPQPTGEPAFLMLCLQGTSGNAWGTLEL